MHVTHIVRAFAAPSVPPSVSTEQHTAALVAKLHHQAAAYQRWQDSLGDEAPPDVSESLRLDYERASADVRQVQGHLRATPSEFGVVVAPRVAALQTRARKLAVAHMLQLRDDDVIAEGNLKIAKSFAHKATLGWRPNPVQVQQTGAARDAQAHVVHAIKQARQRALDSADDATYWAACNALQSPSAPNYPKPPKSILKPPAPPARTKKTVQWDPNLMGRQTIVDTADWVAAERPRTRAAADATRQQKAG